MILVVFRSRLRPGRDETYAALLDEMDRLVQKMPGFISEKTFSAEDGERVSVQEWDSLETLRAWREHPRHLEAQRLGRTRFYASYSLFVADDPRTGHFEGDPA